MMGWVYLGIAILSEVAATLCLRVAATGRRTWFLPVTLGYLAALAFLSLALGEGLALGAAYGIWAAVGVALVAVASKVLFEEPLTLVMSGGIALIAGGVLLIELGAAH